ncbi:MAG: serine/threonine protein kinase [Planctomycetaceae bacterium]|nr:serine/threonine protein kinase [Planctomycetaceae bacterium]
MSHDGSHLAVDQFAQFLEGRLSEPDEATLTQHLDTCRFCRGELETTAGAADWWKDARRFLGLNQNPDSPRDLRADASEAADRLDDEAADPQGNLSLEFLAPTDDPQMLGRLGPYEIAGVVGRGGTGIVLKAFERSLNRFVAVKVLAPYLATSAAARKRFAREAQAAAAVVHEHIVPIYAVDEHQGLPYMVMRYVPGRSLQQRLEKQGVLRLCEVLRIGLQTASGLAAAHAQGLVHRDIKPANILLEQGVERVLLTDFGLARAVDDASLTCSGMVAGTPQYMAPEQARGESIDHRTDLFSLGSVLYAMCAGHSPFRAETTMGVLHRICSDRPRPLRQINPEIPEWFERVIRKLHAQNPARRYQSAGEVAELLAAQLARVQRPGAVLRDPWWQRWGDEGRDWLSQWSWKIKGAALLAAMALTVVAAQSLWPTAEPKGHRNAPIDRQGASSHERDSRVVSARERVATPLPRWVEQTTELDAARRFTERLEQALSAAGQSAPDSWPATVRELQAELSRLELELNESPSTGP